MVNRDDNTDERLDRRAMRMVMQGGGGTAVDPRATTMPDRTGTTPFHAGSTTDAPPAPTTIPGETPAPTGTPDGNKPRQMADVRTRAGLEDYFASRGVKPYDGSIDYWMGKAQDPAFADDKYFQDRLSQADEFSNKGPHWDWTQGGGGGMATAPAPTPGGNSLQMPMDNGFLQQLLQMLTGKAGMSGTPGMDRQALLSLIS